MDGMLSQDEIEALLSGMSLPDEETSDSSDSGIASLDSSQVAEEPAVSGDDADSDLLTDVEKDAIGEVGNISMGSSATTLYSLVNRKVNITTPIVQLAKWESILKDYERPCVFIKIKYTKGLDGTNNLVLKEHDVKVITDLMMGGDGTNTDGELGELHLSAISEAMNQMMGSAATSLSTMLQKMIDISPPESSLLDLSMYKSGAEISPFLAGTFVKISFRMQIDELVDSTIMQLYPVDFAKDIVSTFISTQMGGAPAPEQAPPQPSAPPPQPNAQAMNMGAAPAPDMGGMGAQTAGMPGMDMNAMNMGMMNPQMQMGMMNPQMQMGMMNPQMQMGMMNPQMQMGMMNQQMGMANVNVQPAQFQSFSNGAGNIPGQENIGLIMDVPLEVTVELGRTSKSISEILNFAPGTILEIDRIAGEPIDVLVNGKFVAKGEVVVIEESFGVRITEIIKD